MIKTQKGWKNGDGSREGGEILKCNVLAPWSLNWLVNRSFSEGRLPGPNVQSLN